MRRQISRAAAAGAVLDIKGTRTANEENERAIVNIWRNIFFSSSWGLYLTKLMFLFFLAFPIFSTAAAYKKPLEQIQVIYENA